MSFPARTHSEHRPQHAERAVLARYIAAVLLSSAALAVTKLSVPVFGGAHPLFALAAVSLAALWFGIVPGVLTAGLCTVGIHELLARTARAGDAYRTVAFALLAVLIAWASGLLRAAISRREGEKRLQRQLEFTHNVTAALGEGVCATDRDGNVTFMNPAAEKMLGWSESDLRGLPLHQHIHPRCARSGTPPPGCPALRRARSPCPDNGDMLTRRDGSTLPVRCACWPMPDGGSVVTFQDYTEHLRAEQRERLLDEVTRQLSESIDFDVTLKRVAHLAAAYMGDWCMLVVLDRNGEPRRVAVETTNPAKLDAAQALLDRYPIDLSAKHGVGKVLRTGQAELLPEISDFVGEGATAPLRLELLREIGLRSLMSVPLRARGQLLGVIDIGISDSDRRYGPQDLALAEELARRCALAIDNARLYREAQEATRVREEILAVVSHDLRSPLSAIQMASRTLGKLAPAGQAGEAVRRTGQTVHRNATRMGRLIHDLLDFASIEAGRLAIVVERQDVSSIAREAVESFRAAAQERKLTVHCQAERDLSPVSCDRDRILQVLSNLLGNAANATPPGGTVVISIEERGDDVLLSVADTGAGIPPEDLPHIFDRYWRGRSARYRGTGLGLSIAKGIVEAHGGRIWSESRLGAGSAFRFALPKGGLARHEQRPRAAAEG